MTIRSRYVDTVVADVEATSLRYTESTDPRTAQRRVAVVLVTTALALTFIRFAQGGLPEWLADRSTVEFARLARWGVVNVTGYILLPWLAVRFVLREPFSAFGLSTAGLRSGWRPYAWLLGLSVPFVIAASFLPAFQVKYPFYDLAPGEPFWPWFVAWWAIYALQFLGVELFFRGFMVHGLAGRFGVGAVFAMVVPYVMIHFTKPLFEALAALVGGTVLGFLSLKTGSIWWGVAVHVAIAVLMDVLALMHAGIL